MPCEQREAWPDICFPLATIADGMDPVRRKTQS